MNAPVNPYADWLSIDAAEPNFYDLLGLPLFDGDPDRIHGRYLERYALVRKYQGGRFGEQAIALLEELTQACHCLEDADCKRRYDDQLWEQLSPEQKAEFTAEVVEPDDSPPEAAAPVAAVAPGKVTAPSNAHPESDAAPGAASWVWPVRPAEYVASEASAPPPTLRDFLAELWPRTQRGCRAARRAGVQFDGALRRLLGEENALLHWFARVMLYAVFPGVLLGVSWIKITSARSHAPITPDGPELAGAFQSAPRAETPVDAPVTRPAAVSKKLSPPSAAAQASLGGYVATLIIHQMLDDLSLEQKRALAGDVARLADDARDRPEERYVLLCKAAELALEAGDPDLVNTVVNALDDEYVIDVREMPAWRLTRSLLAQLESAETHFAEDLADSAAPAPPAGVTDAPAFARDEIEESLRMALAAHRAYQASGRTTEYSQAYYVALTELAERFTYADALDPTIAELVPQVERVSVVERFVVLATQGPAQLRLPQVERPNDGIVLHGRVQEIVPRGALYEIQLWVATSSGFSTVPVLSPTAPSLQTGEYVVVLGALVDDPTTRIAGYDGAESTVIWLGHAAPIGR